jgi:hypothetical protein
MTGEQHDRIEAILEMVKDGRIRIDVAMKDIERILHKKPGCEFAYRCNDWIIALRCPSWCLERMKTQFKDYTNDK